MSTLSLAIVNRSKLQTQKDSHLLRPVHYLCSANSRSLRRLIRCCERARDSIHFRGRSRPRCSRVLGQIVRLYQMENLQHNRIQYSRSNWSSCNLQRQSQFSPIFLHPFIHKFITRSAESSQYYNFVYHFFTEPH